VPSDAARLQASHWPPQARLQHTPSTQNPDAHWLAPPQVAPGASLGTHAPAEQKSPATQSLSTAQLDLHAVAPHAYGAQLVVDGAGQAPLPLHCAAAVATPAAQLGARHWVAAPGYAHAVVVEPLHAPPQALPSLVQAGRVPTGAPLTGLQAPPAPQASHCPVQARLQHTPSAQNPDAHWVAAPCGAPSPSLGAQAPPLQKSPATQSPSVAQLVLHAVAPHRYGAQVVVETAGQPPAPSQFAARLATLFVQLGARHWVAAPG
jgi:hypothetical protein